MQSKTLLVMTQQNLGTNFQKEIERVEEYKFEPIKGYPMLHWKGKRPFESTQFYPAQLKETHGEEVDGWFNQIFWGDNLQVMSHLLKEFRGKIKLIYLDPPFDSNADYKKKIQLRGKEIINDQNAFEEKQYKDIWTNDEYLQFIYERLILIRELLSDDGSIWLQCDYRKDAHLRLIMDEIFGPDRLKNQIIWNSTRSKGTSIKNFGVEHQILFYYTKSNDFVWNQLFSEYDEDKLDRYYCYFEQPDKSYKKYSQRETRQFRLDNNYPNGKRFALIPLTRMLGGERSGLTYEFMGFTKTWACKEEKMLKLVEAEMIVQTSPNSIPQKKQYLDDMEGIKLTTLWDDISPLNPASKEKTNYPTQKPEALLERIIKVSTNPKDIVFDCFMGSGTAQVTAMKLGRRFIGADINLGAIQTTTKRLITNSKDLQKSKPALEFEPKNVKVNEFYTGFQIYNVNHYEFFRNELEAKDLLLRALEIQPVENNSLYDGEKDGRMVKIMPVNRITSRADLNELITNFDQRAFEKQEKENPGKPVVYLTLVCMGHEPDLAAHLQNEMKPHRIDVEVVDILKDKSKLELKRDAEAEIVKEKGKVIINQFYPMNLLQKLSLDKQNVEDWKELVESVMIDFNYDGAIFEPKFIDIPEGNELVKGEYQIPEDAGTVHVKITDLLSESLELTIK